jgi:hypothetical protein
MGMDGMRLHPYNGWENKFTWLMHLHLSNEEHLMEEITTLVAREPNDGAAGRLVEMWVKVALTNWLTMFPNRQKQHDEEMRLLAWDLLGSALAYAEWVPLVDMLMSGAVPGANLLTMTLYRSVLGSNELQVHVGTLLSQASSLYAGADAVKEWFELQLDTWIEAPAARLEQHTPLSVLFQGLMQNTYAVIFWEHVARAFRPGY